MENVTNSDILSLSVNYSESTQRTVLEQDLRDDNDALQVLVSGFMLTSFSLIGIVGNAVSLTVMSRPSMRSSVNCVLQALAAFDLGVLASAILMLGLRSLSKSIKFFSFYSWYLYPRILPVVYPLGLIFQTGSIWSTVAVTVERFVAVCYPLKARSLCTHRNAKFYNALVLVLSIVYNLPRFFEANQVYVIDGITNETVLTIQPTEFRKNKVYIEVYYIWLYLFFIYFIPFVILAFLNVAIWKTVRKANHDRRTLSRHQRREMSMAAMLLSVVAVFFLCNALGLVVNILEYCNVTIEILIPFSNFLVVINSSINFVIYCIFGRRFKRLFMETLLCRTCYRINRNDTTNDSLTLSTHGVPRGRTASTSRTHLYNDKDTDTVAKKRKSQLF